MKYVYALKTVKSDMTSHNGFTWKRRGTVVAPDWNPEPECGGGLHAFLRGEGDGSLADWSTDALWLVLKIPEGTYVDLGGKIKFPRCTVVFCGDRKSATDKLQALGCNGPIIGAYKVGGDGSTVSGGYGSVLTLSYYDGTRHRLVTRYVGEDGIRANTKYRLNNAHKFEEVK